jgi:hypothetical protein
MGGQGRGLHAKAVNMQDLAGYIGNWTENEEIGNSLRSCKTTYWRILLSDVVQVCLRRRAGADG